MTAEFEVISVTNEIIIVIMSAIAHGGMPSNAASCSPISSDKPDSCVEMKVETIILFVYPTMTIYNSRNRLA